MPCSEIVGASDLVIVDGSGRNLGFEGEYGLEPPGGILWKILHGISRGYV